jgi:phage FluMu protein Com
MLELEVILEFACCECGDPTGVTVKWAGKSPGADKKAAASVKIPCPKCQSINQILFSPDDGTLLHVTAADKPRYLIPVPSCN